MGSCPVACCTKFAPLPATRFYVPPPASAPPAYYMQPPPSYFQPQQQPWPTTCPAVCRSRCISTCPIHCCDSSVLDNLRRLASVRDHHQNVAKSLTPVTPDTHLHQQDQKESSSAVQPPPISLSPLISTASSSPCPVICSRHCTKACSRECCVAQPNSARSSHEGLARRSKILHRRKPGKRVVAHRRKLFGKGNSKKTSRDRCAACCQLLVVSKQLEDKYAFKSTTSAGILQSYDTKKNELWYQNTSGTKTHF